MRQANLMLAALVLVAGSACSSRGLQVQTPDPFDTESPTDFCYIDLRSESLQSGEINEALVDRAIEHWKTTKYWDDRELSFYRAYRGRAGREIFYVFLIAGVDDVYAAYGADSDQTVLRRYFTFGSWNLPCE